MFEITNRKTSKMYGNIFFNYCENVKSLFIHLFSNKQDMLNLSFICISFIITII